MRDTTPAALGTDSRQMQASGRSEIGGAARLGHFGLADRDVDWIAHMTGLGRRRAERPDDPSL
eukprot:7670735-Pyramimonas_sp.AAC.1